MSTKLTLSLDDQIIKSAKAYAKKQNVSLSFLVQNYFLKLTKEEISFPKQEQKESIVKQLSGIIKDEGTWEEEYTEFLIEKYK